MRMGIAVTIAIVLGVVLGVVFANVISSEPVMEDQSAALTDLNLKLEKMESKYQDALQAHEKLQTAYRSLKDAAAQSTPAEDAPKEEDISAYMEDLETELFEEQPERQGRDRGRRGPEQAESQETEEERAAREAEQAERRQQWEDFREQRRIEREESFSNAIANAKDKETQERVEAIQNFQDYFSELRDVMAECGKR